MNSLKHPFCCFTGYFTASLAAWDSQAEIEPAFPDVKLPESHFQVCVDQQIAM